MYFNFLSTFYARFCNEVNETFFHFIIECLAFTSLFSPFSEWFLLQQQTAMVNKTSSGFRKHPQCWCSPYDPMIHLEQQRYLEDIIEAEQTDANLQPGVVRYICYQNPTPTLIHHKMTPSSRCTDSRTITPSAPTKSLRPLCQNHPYSTHHLRSSGDLSRRMRCRRPPTFYQPNAISIMLKLFNEPDYTMKDWSWQMMTTSSMTLTTQTVIKNISAKFLTGCPSCTS